MRKTMTFIACAFALASVLSSCQKIEAPVAAPQGRTITFTATNGDDTKTNFKKGTVSWLAGDIIDVYDAAGTKGSHTLAAEEISADGKSITFSVDGLGDAPYYAATYAGTQSAVTYDAATHAFGITYGSGRTQQADSFGYADCCVAVSNTTALNFKHTCGWLCFYLNTNDPDATGKIRKLTLALNTPYHGVVSAIPTIDGAPEVTLAEDATKSLEFLFTSGQNVHERTFFVPVPAGAYRGAEITAAIGGTAYSHELETSKVITVERGGIVNMGDISSMIKKSADIKWVPVTDPTQIKAAKSVIAFRSTDGITYAMIKTATAKNPVAADIATIATVGEDGSLTGVDNNYVFQFAPSANTGYYNIYYYTSKGVLAELGGSSTAQGISILANNTNTTDWWFHIVEGKGMQMQAKGIDTRFVYVMSASTFRLITEAQASGIVIYQKQ